MYVIWIMMVYVFLLMILVIKGPAIWDRLLGMNLVSIKFIIIIVAFASIYDIVYLLDFAIMYSLSGFIGMIFITLFCVVRKRRRK